MKFLELIQLIGLQSTNPKMQTWFETYNLGKLPKTITCNQGDKHFNDKPNLVSYKFKYDIIHKDYYPPISTKNNNYTFNVFLTCIIVFSNYGKNKKKFVDPKPDSFWEGFVNPKSSFEECLAFFDNKVKESIYDGDLLHYYFEKKLSDLVVVTLFYAADKSGIKEIDLELIEHCEAFGQSDFSKTNEYNTVKQAYLLVVKWLFDNDYLIQNENFPKTLSFDTNEIIYFISIYLQNHVWDNQIKEIPLLFGFLLNIRSSMKITTHNGIEIDLWIKDLFVKAAGKFEERNNTYKPELRNYEDVEKLEKSIYLTENQSKIFFKILDESFELYKEFRNNPLNQI